MTEIAAFWREAGAKAWFMADPLLDAEIAMRFGHLIQPAADALEKGEHPAEAEAKTALGLCVLLDQFPRNIYRGLTRSWVYDPLVLGVAERAVQRGYDRDIEDPLRQFFYTPFMHAENMDAQDRCVELTETRMRDPNYARHAHAHREEIRRFGRFPRRNPVLGRATTPEERAWLKEGGYAAELDRQKPDLPG